MKKYPSVSATSVLILVLMASSSLAALHLTPTHRMADDRKGVSLDALVPQKFGDWHVDSTVVPIQVSPEVRQQLDKFYDQTLSRTYVNSRNERVMLSIAYGGQQSRSLQLHRPEVCYAAQGFVVNVSDIGRMLLGAYSLEVTRLIAKLGPRNEPITYWMRVGDSVVSGRFGQAMARYKYGLSGIIPDGILFRVSTISTDSGEGFEVQNKFVSDLLEHTDITAKRMLVGVPGTGSLSSVDGSTTR